MKEMENSNVDLDGLLPITESDRPMGLASYVLVMWSSAIVIQVMAIGTFLLDSGLGLFQTILVGVLSAIFVSFFAAANGHAGIKYGIPFSMQARSSFGYNGAKLAYIIRIIPALAWYGIGTWIGAESIQQIVGYIFDGPNLVFLYFFLLTAVQILLSVNGITSIVWFDAIVAIIIFIMLGYFTFEIISKGDIDFTQYTGTSFKWGLVFWGGASAATANWATVMLNHSDIMRHVKPANVKTNFIGNFLGIIPPWLTMVLFGVLVFVGTGYEDPIPGLVQLAPTPLFGIVLLVFVILAQISSNLSTSVLPAALAFQDLLKISWKTGVIIAGVISCITFPWLLFTSDWFFWFQNLYSVFLGPILGILLADYWVIQKGKLNLTSIYEKESKAYMFIKGFSPIAVLTLLISGGLAYFVFFEVSWLFGTPCGFILYTVLKKSGIEKKIETKDSFEIVKEHSCNEEI